jgi:hypothetical protein
MAYNKFQWWMNGQKTNKVLGKNSSLLSKIKNGDFDYSPLFDASKKCREDADLAYELAYKNYIGNDESNRKRAAEDSARMTRVRAIKLKETANEQENKRLIELRKALNAEFGVDLWDKMMEEEPMSLVELYNWYGKQVRKIK